MQAAMMDGPTATRGRLGHRSHIECLGGVGIRQREHVTVGTQQILSHVGTTTK